MVDDVLTELSILSGDILPVRRISDTVGTDGTISKRGTYYLEEDELPKNLQPLLHGRAYVQDQVTITNVVSSDPFTFYIAASKTQGLIIPARSMSIKVENSIGHYRWTDDGIKWTGWITLPNGIVHSYLPQEKNRFSEIQVYMDTSGGLVSVRASR